ncbi:TRADD-N-associated membrane domain-containing protein [Paenibacillus xylanexedens]|uniref:Cyanobacterial TRADD-N associated 2 transmembrane domain-containing protein n=1 Tax=Paenibacillus xylanexedens TaxID=528191 RepID=A0ABS4RPG7_PAEXY|nr:hypothetical protein [Paenibacillus xylanexedens]MBP2244260.1 hypothetical protein [Paenibacillus xylanexedens]
MSEETEIPIKINDTTTDNVELSGDAIGLDFIDSKIQKLIGEKETDQKLTSALRYFFGIVTITGILICSGFIDTFLYIGIVLIVIGGLIFAASFSDTKQGRLAAEIKTLELQKERLEKKSASNETSRYYDSLVSINLRNLEEYYDLVKISNKKSFFSSLIMSFLGILIILCALCVSYFTSQFKDITYIVTASGIVVEVIAGLMFFLYSRTVLQLKSYHDSLIDVQNVLLSFKLIEDTKDEKIKSEMMKQMIENLIQRK